VNFIIHFSSGAGLLKVIFIETSLTKSKANNSLI